jgi:hypothetical protein
MLFYILEVGRGLNKNCVFFIDLLPHKISEPHINLSMLVLLMVGNQKVQKWGGNKKHNIYNTVACTPVK